MLTGATKAEMAIVGIGGAGFAFVHLAQVAVDSTGGTTSWLFYLKELGSVVVICYLFWFVITRAMPGMQDGFKVALKEQQDDFQRGLVSQRESYREIDKVREAAHQEALEAIRIQHQSLIKRVMDNQDRLITFVMRSPGWPKGLTMEVPGISTMEEALDEH